MPRTSIRVTPGQPEAIDRRGPPEERGGVLPPGSEIRIDRVLRDALGMTEPEVQRQPDELLDELRRLLLRRRGLDHPDALDRPRVEPGRVEQDERIDAAVERQELPDHAAEVVT